MFARLNLYQQLNTTTIPFQAVFSRKLLKRMRRGYIRVTSRVSKADQWQALISAGVPEHAIYVEGEIGTLSDAVRSLREGDELCVYTLDRIAGDKLALRDWMARVRGKKAAVVEVLTGRTTGLPEDVAEMVFDALKRKGHSTEDAKRYGKMRKAKKLKAKVSRPAALAIWRDATMTRDEAAKKIGLSPATCFRRYGSRGTPPGRRPADDRKS